MAKQKKETVETDISKLIEALERKFGLSVAPRSELEIVSSGSYTLNIATHTDGYVRGKIVEIYGPESSGKSTIVLHAVAEFQQATPDRKVALFDYEHSFDPMYAQSIGVDVENLLIYQPNSQEQGYDLLLGLAEQGLISLAVIDSHTAAIPKAIIEGDMGAATMALQARNNSKFLGKIKGILGRTGITLIAVSQTRANIGGMTADVNIATGGNAWKFYSDMRFKIWKLNDKGNELNKTTVDVIKNKCAKPYGKAEFNINWGTGIDIYAEILDLSVKYNIVKQAGSWFSYQENKLGQGASSVAALLSDNKELFEEIKSLTLSKVYATSEVTKMEDEI